MGRGTPVRSKAVESCDKVKRNVFCQKYSECLNQAILRKWPGFSCERCNSYEQENLEGERLSDDYARCIALAFFTGAIELKTRSRIRA